MIRRHHHLLLVWMVWRQRVLQVDQYSVEYLSRQDTQATRRRPSSMLGSSHLDV